MWMCLVLGLVLGMFAISMAPSLSSNTLHLILGTSFVMGVLVTCATSLSKRWMGRITLVASDSATYSLSVEDTVNKD